MFKIENKEYRVWWKHDISYKKITTITLKRNGRKHILIKELQIRTTTCVIQDASTQAKTWVGTSECSPDDMYYRPLGRGISLDKAIESMLNDSKRNQFNITYDTKSLNKLRRDIISQISEKVNIVLE